MHKDNLVKHQFMAIKEIDKLKELDFKRQLVFAFLTSERLYPNYVYFSKKFAFGNPDIFREAIDFVYQSIFQTSNIEKQKVEYLLYNIFNNIPNTNDFTTFYATIAMYSGGIIYESLNLINKTDTDKILIDISTMATDAVDCFIQVRDNMEYGEDGFEEKILSDPIMLAEVEIQKGIINFLYQRDKIDQDDILTLLELQNNNKTGSLNF